MAAQSESGGAAGRVAVEGEMTVFTAHQTKAQLLEPLSHCNELEVDLSGVSDIDTSGLQLLVLVKREAAGQGKTLHFVGHSAAVLELIDLADLGGYFGDPLLIRSKTPGEEKRP